MCSQRWRHACAILIPAEVTIIKRIFFKMCVSTPPGRQHLRKVNILTNGVPVMYAIAELFGAVD